MPTNGTHATTDDGHDTRPMAPQRWRIGTYSYMYAWHAWPPCGTPFDHVGVPSAAEAWLALVLTGLFVCE